MKIAETNFTTMNAKILAPTLFLALSSLTTTAQITIIASDLPQADVSYGRTTAVTTDIDPTETGADFTWDFSELQSLNTQNDNFVSVQGAPFSYQFLFNNPATPNYLATAAQATELEIGFDALTIEDPYAFYRADENAYEQIGLGATINGFALPSTYNPIDVIYNLPLTFGDEGGSESNVIFAVPLLGLWQGEQIRSYEVDGYGSLTTPYNTYDCLRTKTILNGEDSLYIALLQIGQSIPRIETVVYSWLAKEEGVPVLEVTTQLGAVTQVRFKDEAESVSEPTNKKSLALANGQLTWGPQQPITVSVFDMNGKEVMRASPTGQSLSLRNLAAGVYIAKAHFGKTEEVLKLVIGQ